MIIVHNKILPFGSYVAMTIGPFIFTKRANLSWATVQHENIHWQQEKETLIVGFYVLYVAMFVYEYLRCLFDKKRGRLLEDRCYNTAWKRAYRSILFEREAYKYENDENYLENRRHYAWIKA